MQVEVVGIRVTLAVVEVMGGGGDVGGGGDGR